jgi:hypothetical protein
MMMMSCENGKKRNRRYDNNIVVILPLENSLFDPNNDSSECSLHPEAQNELT